MSAVRVPTFMVVYPGPAGEIATRIVQDAQELFELFGPGPKTQALRKWMRSATTGTHTQEGQVFMVRLQETTSNL